MITIKAISDRKKILRITELARLSKIDKNTMAGKIKRLTPLKEHEIIAIEKALKAAGIALTEKE